MVWKYQNCLVGSSTSEQQWGGDGATVLQGLPEAGRVMLQVQALQGVQSERVDLWRWHRAVGSLPGGIPMSSEEALIHENAGGHWISRQEL